MQVILVFHFGHIFSKVTLCQKALGVEVDLLVQEFVVSSVDAFGAPVTAKGFHVLVLVAGPLFALFLFYFLEAATGLKGDDHFVRGQRIVEYVSDFFE